MSKRSLTDRAVDGIAWQFLAVGGNVIMRGAILILLTRSLASREFGIIAAAMVILSVAERVGLIGVNRVLVQKQVLTDELVRSAFAISLWAGFLLTVPVYLGADLFADLLIMPQLSPYVEFLSISLLLGSVASIPIALLERELRFKALSIAEMGSYFLGFGLIALPLAHYGYGAWSLAIGAMAQAVSRILALFVLRRPPVGFWPAKGVIDDLVRPGIGFSAGQLGNFAATQIDNLIVGRLLGAEALGYYSRAYQFLMLPAQLFGKAVASVLFPTMASLQDQPERVARAYLRAIGLIALLTLPASFFFIIIAPELVRFLLGKDWIGMIVPFQILIATLLFRTSYKISDAVTLAMGSMRSRAWRQWVYAALVTAGTAIGARWGLAGVALGVGIALICNFLMMLQLAQRLLKLSFRSILFVHLQQLRNSALICAPVWLAVEVSRTFGYSDFIILVISTIVSVIATGVIWFWFRSLLGDIGEWLDNLISARFQKMRKDKSARAIAPCPAAADFEHGECLPVMNGPSLAQEIETSGFPFLPILPDLLNRLAAAQVRFGVYKNLASLDQGITGADDLDIIVAKDDAARFHEILNGFQAVLGTCSPLYDNAVPGRQDWFVPDISGRTLHLDVSFGLQIGPKFNKHYRALEYGDIADWQARSVGGSPLPVASALDEARIAVLRSVFRLNAWTLSGWTRLDARTQRLLDSAFPEGTDPITLEYRIGSQVVSCPIRRDAGHSGIATKSVRQLRAAIGKADGSGLLHRALLPISDPLVHFARKGAFGLARRWTARDPARNMAKRRVYPSGIIVALIGPDGVGKSTQAARLGAMFQRKFRCAAVYMGSNDGAWMALHGRLRKRLATIRGKAPALPERSVQGTTAPLTYRKSLEKGVWRLVIAIQRHAALRKCLRLANRGAVVIADRWPQALAQGYLDGPSVQPQKAMKLPSWLWAIENRIYARMAGYKPTLTVHLDCDYATSNARKPDDISADDFERRVSLMRQMRDLDPDIKVVDARQSMDEVTAELSGWAWFAVWRAQNLNGLRGSTGMAQPITLTSAADLTDPTEASEPR